MNRCDTCQNYEEENSWIAMEVNKLHEGSAASLNAERNCSNAPKTRASRNASMPKVQLGCSG